MCWPTQGLSRPALEARRAPCCYRFRTDVTWEGRLQATQAVPDHGGASAARVGLRIDLESHEEITTHDLLAMIDSISDEVPIRHGGVPAGTPSPVSAR